MNAYSPTAAAVAPAPIDALLERYVAMLSAEKNLSRFTLRNYASDLRHLMAYLDERGVKPLTLTRVIFRGYLASMQEAGVAQGSVARRVSTARSFYKWLRLTGVMSEDPLANVSGPRQAKRLPRALTLEDITNIIAAADGDRPTDLRDRALLELMYACGLRVSEAASLDVGHIDVEQRTALVHGKGNKERLVVMGEPARDAVERYLRHGRPGLVKRQRATNTPDPASSIQPPPSRPGSALLLNRGGTRLSQRRIQLLVKKYALKAGIDARIHPHLFRHTFATHLLDGGADLRVVQELMGHSSPNTTQIYLHVTEERQRKVLESSLDEIAQIEMARRAARGSNRR